MQNVSVPLKLVSNNNITTDSNFSIAMTKVISTSSGVGPDLAVCSDKYLWFVYLNPNGTIRNIHNFSTTGIINRCDSIVSTLYDNTDTWVDFIIGDTANGCTWLLSGTGSNFTRFNISILTQNPGNSPTKYGTAIAILGDIDHNGIPDILVSDPIKGNPNSKGIIYVHLMFTDRALLASSFEIADFGMVDAQMASDNYYLGEGVAAVGDVDLNNVTDFVCVAPGSGRGGRQIFTALLQYTNPGNVSILSFTNNSNVVNSYTVFTGHNIAFNSHDNIVVLGDPFFKSGGSKVGALYFNSIIANTPSPSVSSTSSHTASTTPVASQSITSVGSASTLTATSAPSNSIHRVASQSALPSSRNNDNCLFFTELEDLIGSYGILTCDNYTGLVDFVASAREFIVNPQDKLDFSGNVMIGFNTIYSVQVDNTGSYGFLNAGGCVSLAGPLKVNISGYNFITVNQTLVLKDFLSFNCLVAHNETFSGLIQVITDQGLAEGCNLAGDVEYGQKSVSLSVVLLGVCEATESSTGGKNNLGIIVGATVGGVGLCIVIALIVSAVVGFVIFKRKQFLLKQITNRSSGLNQL